MDKEYIKKYNEYVELAKAELKSIEGHEIRICEYAMKVCDIRHGGHSNGYYTIKAFASDIGMNAKTLSNWLLVYRNVIVKLDKKITSSADFLKAKKVESYLREERIVNNRINEKPVGTKFSNKNCPTPDDKIRSIYNSIDHSERPFEGEFAMMLRSSKHNLALIEKRDLKIIDDKQLAYLMETLDKTSDIINEYLTNKKKASGRLAS